MYIVSDVCIRVQHSILYFNYVAGFFMTLNCVAFCLNHDTFPCFLQMTSAAQLTKETFEGMYESLN